MKNRAALMMTILSLALINPYPRPTTGRFFMLTKYDPTAIPTAIAKAKEAIATDPPPDPTDEDGMVVYAVKHGLHLAILRSLILCQH